MNRKHIKTFTVIALIALVGCANPVLRAKIQPSEVPETNAPLDEAVLYRVHSICLTESLGISEQLTDRAGKCECLYEYYSGWTNLQFKKYHYETMPKVAFKETLTAGEQQQYDEVEQKKAVCRSTSNTWSNTDDAPTSKTTPDSTTNHSDASSLESKLVKLKSLFDKGLITELEYAIKRKSLLDKGI